MSPRQAHRARQRKPVKTRARRVKVEGALRPGQAICDECHRTFDLAPKPGHPTYEVPAFWDGKDDLTAPTAHLCSTPCFEKWYAEHKPRKITHASDRAPRQPKNTAPMESMFDQSGEPSTSGL